MSATEKTSDIRLIALDLDGTTLTKRGITGRTRRTLEKAMVSGIHVVIATGRVYSALPSDVFQIKGLEYVITSNGAQITDLRKKKVIYSDCIDKDALKPVKTLLQKEGYPIELFTDGKAYIDRNVYEELREHGSAFMNAPYVLRTRIPVEQIYEFWDSHSERMENINIHFPSAAEKEKMRIKLSEMKDITVTSSVRHNLEIGGKQTSKARGLNALCRILQIDMKQVMACGDSPNDLAMIEEAGFGVVMANGEKEVLERADYVAPSNEREGVAYVVEKFVLGKAPEKWEICHKWSNLAVNSCYKAARKSLAALKRHGRRQDSDR